VEQALPPLDKNGITARVKGFFYAIWLMPCAEQRGALERIVRSLSSRFRVPSFAPHATLCSGVWTQSEASLLETVERLPMHWPVDLSIAGIDWVEAWFGFFFIRLRCESGLFIQAAECVEGAHPPGIGPHVSLLYGFGDQRIDREALRAEWIGSLPPILRFDALALVCPAANRWEDIAGWKTGIPFH
jgi:hypothetical protein